MQSNLWKSLLIGTALLAGHGAAHAVDSISLGLAAGDKVQMVQVAAQWDWSSRWFQSNGSHISGYWDLSLAEWRGTSYQNTPGQTQHLSSVGITPVFRWQQDNKKGAYLEGGVGAYLLSSLYNNENKVFSTRFQFGDHVGIGYVFNNKLDLGLRIQHFSNAGIKKPNPGINLVGVRASYAF